MVTGFGFGQPVINNPSPLEVCGSNTGFATFDLTAKNAEILGSLSTSSHTISYHSTSFDAINNVLPISLISPYSNINAYNQVIWARVAEIATSLFSITQLELIANPNPLNSFNSNFIQNEIGFDGIATFDLSSKIAQILNGQIGLNVSFYQTLADAQTNGAANQLNFNYTNVTNPQVIYTRVTNTTTQCYSINSFQLIVNPLNVYIPDANFKAKLIATGVDTNIDGEIQISEALAVTNLTVSNANIYDLTGIESFINLTFLDCSFNQLNVINILPLLNLQSFDCSNNFLTNIGFTGLSFLNSIICSRNQFTSIDFSGLSNLKYIYCGNNNNLTSLNLNGLINLEIIDCKNASLTNLNVSDLENLKNLFCSNNLISALNMSSLTNISILSCSFNLLTDLTFYTNNNNLRILECANNLLTNLILNNLPNLENLDIDNNNISSINFFGLNQLQLVLCRGNQVTTLDFSNCPIFYALQCSNNQNLIYINLKNGEQHDTGYYDWQNNPNLRFICVDENEIEAVKDILFFSNLTYTTLNTYCSFTLGGTYNTITGAVKFDSDYNGCDNLDPIAKNIKVNINDGTNSGNTFTNNSGIYNYYVQQPNLTIAPVLENPSYFNVTPVSSIVNFPANNNSVEVRDFCLSANGFNPDAEVVLVALDQPIPGFNCRYQIILKNKGNTAFFQDAKFNFDSNKMTYVSSSEPYSSQTTGQVTFYNAVAQEPFEVRMYECVMRINAPTDASPVNSGDIINTSALSLVTGDNTLDDNLSNLSQIAVNSFDPNDKTCLEGDFVNPTKIGQYLHYNINFENTGTADAVNIVVKDVLDVTKFDINSLQVIYASDEVRTDVKGNVAEFIFQNINLALANGGPGGHGNVLFKIKTLPTLPIDTEVKNKANIYFDYNFPIITNEAKTTFAVLSNSGFVLDNSVSVYPNPSDSRININCNNAIKSIEVYDVQGRILETIINSKNIIDISEKSNGIYFLKINTDKGSKVEKIIKD